jgi:hypothetical protein
VSSSSHCGRGYANGEDAKNRIAYFLVLLCVPLVIRNGQLACF